MNLTISISKDDYALIRKLQKELGIFNRSKLIRHCLKSFYRRHEQKRQNEFSKMYPSGDET